MSSEQSTPPSLRGDAAAELGRVRRWVGELGARSRRWWREEREARRAPVPSPGNVAGLPWWVWVLFIGGVGVALRLYYFGVKAGMHYPDEIFQYMEPAYWRMHGDAWLPWEYERGVRNWVLPGYYGSLMQLGEWLGLRGWELHRFLALHNSLFGALIIPAGYRLGRAVGRGDVRLGLLAALAMAIFPVFGYFGPHTLSEVHGLVFTTWAYALWMEQVAQPDARGGLRKALAVGVLLGAAFITRYTLLGFLPLVALDYNWRGRFAQFFAAAAGFMAMIVVLAIVDDITWGKPLASLIEYVKYNLVEDGASQHGVMPKDFYWEQAFVARMGSARFLLLGTMLLAVWRHWRLIIAWVLPFAAFSLIKHKEERFLLSIWPFLLMASLSGSLWLADGLRYVRGLHGRPLLRHAPLGVAGALLVVSCLTTFHGVANMRMRWKAGIFMAQTWIGRQPDATGVLLEDRQHLNGGYALLDRSVPQLQYSSGRLRNPVYNYVAVYGRAQKDQLLRRKDFEPVAEFEAVTVFRRTNGLVKLVAD